MKGYEQYEELTPVNIRAAISDVRWTYVDAQVSRRVNRREGEFTHDEIEVWQQAAVDRWNERNPVLIKLWRAIDEGRVSVAEQAEAVAQ